MTTITIDNKSLEARRFLRYVKTLPFVVVDNEPVKRFKPEVEEVLRKSERGEDLSPVYDNVEDFFNSLGI